MPEVQEEGGLQPTRTLRCGGNVSERWRVINDLQRNAIDS